MRTVHKYRLSFVADYFTLRLPEGAQSLHFGEQDGEPTLWALVDPAAKLAERCFRIAGTGHPIRDLSVHHIGTAQFSDGALVFHLFEVFP